jgi:hypothetical protein
MGQQLLARMTEENGWTHPLYEGEQPGRATFESTNGRLTCNRDLIFDVFWLLTGQEERHWSCNKHGHFDCRGSAFHRQQVFRLAPASAIGLHFEKLFATLGFEGATPRWPLGKQAAACVSHDVDYPVVLRALEPFRIIRRQGVHGLRAAMEIVTGKRTHWHFLSWVEMEHQLETRSAFYFVPRRGSLIGYALGTPDPFYEVQSDRFRSLFKRLEDEGCEIGLHASYRAGESSEAFVAEKQALEVASGTSIRGNRHHYWHLDPSDPEDTLRIHEQAGLTYDTSLAHERYVGWRRGLSWPYFPFHQRERRELRTLQIPTAWMDDQLFGHRYHNPGDRESILRALVDKAAEQGGCFLIDVHEYVFDDVLFPGWAAAYQSVWGHVLERGDIWVETPGNIAEHWVRRYNNIVATSKGLDVRGFHQ